MSAYRPDEQDQTFDVFIAYYGNDAKGTQRQAEILYDKLSGFRLNTGESLKVYQHTRCNPSGRFGSTPGIVSSSKFLILLVDKDIPCENTGALLMRDPETRYLKRLYEEVSAFRESPSYRLHFDSEVCCCIVCDDMSSHAVASLDPIFAGRACRKWTDELKDDFAPLLRTISRFLTGSDNISQAPSPIEPDHEFKRSKINVMRGQITIGEGAKARLMRLPNGQCAPYECLVRTPNIATSSEDSPFLDISAQRAKHFVPDAEVYADCEKISALISSNENLTDEEYIFRQFIRDIRSGIKQSRLVARIASIGPIAPYGRTKIEIQPIEYLWIMRMTMLDTPFPDGQKMSTLRLKYANPCEERDAFTVADRLAGHIGCGVFIITSDGYLVYQNRFDAQDNRVSFFPGKLSYTVSGSYLINSGSVFDFMNEKIDRELGILSHNLYLWEFGYEYEYLHYQFSFFAFCNETKDQFVACTHPRSAQASKFSFCNLGDDLNLNELFQFSRWEPSAWAVLMVALMSAQFTRFLKSKTGITFNRNSFIEKFREKC